MQSLEMERNVDVPLTKTRVQLKNLVFALPGLLILSFIFYLVAAFFSYLSKGGGDEDVLSRQAELLAQAKE